MSRPVASALPWLLWRIVKREPLEASKGALNFKADALTLLADL
jgi:hypothetical protein